MKKIRIVTDSSCDLNKDIVEKYNIEIVGKTNTGLKLQGEEIDLRLFVLENLYEEIYKDHELDYDVKEELEKIFSDLKLEGSTRKQIIKFFENNEGKCKL